MIKLILDFVQFLYTVFPLVTSVIILALLGVWLSGSIKKHATVYYIIMALPSLMVIIPSVGRLVGVEMPNFYNIPLMGGVLRDYVHMATLGFPLLVIIMYVGALNPRYQWVKRLMSIRKELSIISGFPVLAHSLVRVSYNFIGPLSYFTRHDEYMATTKVVNELGAGISNFSFVLGIVLLALFLPLWITSFDAVHRRMGGLQWKKLQRWSYVLYALLFVHAMGLSVGGALNPRGGGERQRPATENTQAPAARGGGGGHASSISLSDIRVSADARRTIHITSLVLVFGSYLYLRVRKANASASRRKAGDTEKAVH
ncbi:MAG: hypothetical protein LBS05_01900 [Tannerellaceae bacterium]|jgi:DMSO/TMAO reductase YedYZ heme-binding membrane subunit|nr:hypothetical protein [Tannerellaceae bacterium]